ncbi:preprotein translocase subunit SecE [Methylogaea oryzae]|uniref:Protein translocase subunit SecE n=1 Tax=Methylogaea oryzae TaxID=1295382 RepID=A0A8D5AII2_9GAMM|nr:preprotein translocase subunit SecE [Methylogaea oryzae]BBL69764.1 protein translocase subunit SecE [Methylogaea oryzae]
MTAQAQSETQSTALDTIKSVLAVLAIVAGIAGFYYFSEYGQLYRVLGVLGAVVVSSLFGFSTAHGRSFLVYARDSRIELSRVVWPTRRETMQATLLVVAMVFVVGMLLWLLDMFLLWGVQLLTGQGG